MNFIKSVILSSALAPFMCFAAHPLISDDPGTQGKGNFQFESNADSSSLTIDDVRTQNTAVNTALTYGVTDTLDVGLNVPYLNVLQDGTATQSGIGDATLLVKWRLYEGGPFSFALKPQLFFPSGDKNKGLGAGKTGYGVSALGALENDGFTVLGNVGYVYADNDRGLLKDIWSASVAVLYTVAPNTKLLFDVGTYRNSDSLATQDPSFALLGLIYGVNKKTDLDVGVKKGLNKAEVDYSVGIGLTYRWGN